MVIPFIILKHMCCVCADVVKQAAASSYNATPQEDIEMNHDNQTVLSSQPRTNTQSAASFPDTVLPNGASKTRTALANRSFRETEFLKLNPVPILWSVSTGPYEALAIQAVIAIPNSEFKRIKYNTISNVVTDLENMVLEYVELPPAHVLEKYKAMLQMAEPIVTFTDSEGIIRHKKYMFLTYSPVSHSWTDSHTGAAVTGLASPSEYLTANRY
jgi:hypothetical protein